MGIEQVRADGFFEADGLLLYFDNLECGEGGANCLVDLRLVGEGQGMGEEYSTVGDGDHVVVKRARFNGL